jgi:hypothetical protein
MQSTIYFNGNSFPPSFGYLEAFAACVDVNNANPAWVVTLQFNGNGSFSFSSFNVTEAELSEAVTEKLLPYKGPPQLPAFYFPMDEADE